MAEATRTFQRNQLVDLQVTGMAFGGKGIAKVDDFVVFVGGAVPGDRVRARIVKNKKRYAEARVEKMLAPSPDRRTPRCSMFGTCGGCVWQDLAYEVQLEYKTSQVRESLEHLGGFKDFELLPMLGMTDPWRYRNRADFSIGQTEEGAIVGFRPRGRWDSVLPLDSCHLLDPSIEKVRATVQDWLREEGIPGWDPRTHQGSARHLLARCSQGGQELLVSLVTAEATPPGTKRLVKRLRSRHPELVGVAHAANPGRAELSAGLPSTTLWGRPFLLEKVVGLTLKISLDAFFQTNTTMAERLYALAIDTAVPTSTEGTCPDAAGRDVAGHDVAGRDVAPVVWDLCAGVGSIGLALAHRAKALLGIEAVADAVQDAQENARLNHIENATFLVGDIAKTLREIADGTRELPLGLRQPDVVILDPPRAGLSNKALKRVGELGAPRIVYVSCNPTTLGPNAATLADYGYRPARVTPVDMFPHTPHVECVALLERQPA